MHSLLLTHHHDKRRRDVVTTLVVLDLKHVRRYDFFSTFEPHI
jgi:hypothetical protein